MNSDDTIFDATLVIAGNVLDMTLPVTELLQSKSNDILKGLDLIQVLKNLAVSTRFSVDSYHNTCYNKALNLAYKINVFERKPRTAGKQIHRSNVPSENISDYFKLTITIPLLDHLNSELENRFGSNTMVSYSGLVIVPTKLISLMGGSKRNWKEIFMESSEFYSEDFPNWLYLDSELDLGETFWVSLKPS